MTVSADPPPISSVTGIQSVTLASYEQQQEHKRLRDVMRAQIERNGRFPSGRYLTTVGAVAKTAGMAPERVVAQLQDGWLVILGVDRSKPIESWTLEEDGE